MNRWLIVWASFLFVYPFAHAGELSDEIDAQLQKAVDGVKPELAPRASDAEFLRATLDLLGRIPTVTEARTFLDSQDANRRPKLVDQLLASPEYTAHSARLWRATLVPQATTNPQTQFLGVSVEAWARGQLRAGKRDDELVRELLTSRLDYLDWSSEKKPQPGRGLSPVGFYQANDLKPETVASAVSRTFLGLKMECALCHDHPFDKWTQKQAWNLSAFFASVAPMEPEIQPSSMLAKRRELKIADTPETATAQFLDGSSPDWKADLDPRAAFATWLTDPANPYFAKVMVNRVWANLFGIGLVDPIDDWGSHNLPSHPELLEALAKFYLASQFDPKPLTRAIVLSEAYQRSSQQTHENQADPRRFLRMNVKGLSAEQLFDSLALATGYQVPGPPSADLAFGWPALSPRGLFIAKFGGGAGRSDMQVSILQALYLLNGEFLTQQTDPERGATVKAIATAPFLDHPGRVEALFLSTLSRRPTKAESERYIAHLEKAENPAKAVGDILWVLLNSQEFLVNR